MSDYAVLGLIGSGVGTRAFYDELSVGIVDILDPYPSDHAVSVAFGLVTPAGDAIIVSSVQYAANDFAVDESIPERDRHLSVVLMLEMGQVLRFTIQPGKVAIAGLP